MEEGSFRSSLRNGHGNAQHQPFLRRQEGSCTQGGDPSQEEAGEQPGAEVKGGKFKMADTQVAGAETMQAGAGHSPRGMPQDSERGHSPTAAAEDDTEPNPRRE